MLGLFGCDEETSFCVVCRAELTKVCGFSEWVGVMGVGRGMGEGCSSFVKWRLGANSLSPL